MTVGVEPGQVLSPIYKDAGGLTLRSLGFQQGVRKKVLPQSLTLYGAFPQIPLPTRPLAGPAHINTGTGVGH